MDMRELLLNLGSLRKYIHDVDHAVPHNAPHEKNAIANAINLVGKCITAVEDMGAKSRQESGSVKYSLMVVATVEFIGEGGDRQIEDLLLGRLNGTPEEEKRTEIALQMLQEAGENHAVMMVPLGQ